VAAANRRESQDRMLRETRGKLRNLAARDDSCVLIYACRSAESLSSH
jgi:hypothetical protein